jgi:hypothetical protein
LVLLSLQGAVKAVEDCHTNRLVFLTAVDHTTLDPLGN